MSGAQTDIHRWNPDNVWGIGGFPMHQGVAVVDGVTVHITGQVGWTADGTLVGPGDSGAQTHKAFDNIAAILAPVGGTIADLVSLTTFYVYPDDIPAIRQARAERLSPETAPISTAIQCAGLVAPDLLVELHGIAVIPHDRFHPPES
ncbi:MAG: RidA family protein [Pseudomonadota bacterium]